MEDGRRLYGVVSRVREDAMEGSLPEGVFVRRGGL